MEIEKPIPIHVPNAKFCAILPNVAPLCAQFGTYSGNIDAVPNRDRNCCDVNVTPLCSSIPTKIFPPHIAPSCVDKVNDALALQTVDILWLHERVRSWKAQSLAGVLTIKLAKHTYGRRILLICFCTNMMVTMQIFTCTVNLASRRIGELFGTIYAIYMEFGHRILALRIEMLLLGWHLAGTSDLVTPYLRCRLHYHKHNGFVCVGQKEYFPPCDSDVANLPNFGPFYYTLLFLKWSAFSDRRTIQNM
jgi:hypothetical protein